MLSTSAFAFAGIANAFAQANRSLVEGNKVLQAELMVNRKEVDRLRGIVAEQQATIAAVQEASDEERIKLIVERQLKVRILFCQIGSIFC